MRFHWHQTGSFDCLSCMALYLITGGSGFIGSHIVEGLVRAGHRVRVLDDFSTGRRENLAGVADRVELIEGSASEEKVVAEAVKGVDGIFHLAAMPSVPRSIKEPLANQ